MLNVTGVLEQTLTPFRGPETGAPDLLQTRSQPSYVDTTKIDQRSLASNVDAGQGDTPAVGVPPCNPSGRQDLNLRPLDPQNFSSGVSARQRAADTMHDVIFAQVATRRP